MLAAVKLRNHKIGMQAGIFPPNADRYEQIEYS
jgi:hypothetical protein